MRDWMGIFDEAQRAASDLDDREAAEAQQYVEHERLERSRPQYGCNLAPDAAEGIREFVNAIIGRGVRPLPCVVRDGEIRPRRIYNYLKAAKDNYRYVQRWRAVGVSAWIIKGRRPWRMQRTLRRNHRGKAARCDRGSDAHHD